VDKLSILLISLKLTSNHDRISHLWLHNMRCLSEKSILATKNLNWLLIMIASRIYMASQYAMFISEIHSRKRNQQYDSPPLIRPLHLHWNSGLIKRMTFLGGDLIRGGLPFFESFMKDFHQKITGS